METIVRRCPRRSAEGRADRGDDRVAGEDGLEALVRETMPEEATDVLVVVDYQDLGLAIALRHTSSMETDRR
jgi:hypothetical protein